MPGSIDHIGLGVPDLAAAERYYDELMPILGLQEWFPSSAAAEFNYGPDRAGGTQVFFYQALGVRTALRNGLAGSAWIHAGGVLPQV